MRIAVWFGTGLFALAGLLDCMWIYGAASAHELPLNQVTTLLAMTSWEESLNAREFTGIEVGILLHAESAISYAVLVLLIGLAQVLEVARNRYEALLWDRIRQLEADAAKAAAPVPPSQAS